jgi:membrane protease YdiL (CAAX protease family)
MNTFISFIKPYRLATFLVLTFIISWGSGLLGIGLLYPFGPSASAVILVLLTNDPMERLEFWRRIIDVTRISARGYLLIILIVPMIMVGAIIIDVLLGGSAPGITQLRQIIAQPQLLIQLVLTTFLIGALSEEIGWRGYALDNALTQWNALRSSLVIGIFWFAWHLPLFAIPGTLQQQWGWFTPMFWIYLLTVVLLSILFTWISLHNRTSILSAILLHFTYNFTLGLILPTSDRMLFIVLIILSVAVALIVRLRPVVMTLPRPLARKANLANDLQAQEGA